MDLSQISNLTSGTTGTSGVQAPHHHHHHKSISDQVNQMGSAIDDAVKAGNLTSDQAASMKKELADITQTLSQSQTSSTNSTSSTGQTNSLSQLSSADRKKVMDELHDVRKQLFSAMNPQDATAATSNTSQINSLFSAMDTNGDGNVDKSELNNYISQLANSNQSAQDLLLGSLYNTQGTMNTATGTTQSVAVNIFA